MREILIFGFENNEKKNFLIEKTKEKEVENTDADMNFS